MRAQTMFTSLGGTQTIVGRRSSSCS